MSEHPGVHVSIGGDQSGQLAVGSHIRQTQVPARPDAWPDVTGAAGLDEVLAALRTIVATRAPEQTRDQAREQLDRFGAAARADTPDLGVLYSVRSWFSANAAALAGAVTSAILGPAVGALVSAAGDSLVREFTALFGAAPGR